MLIAVEDPDDARLDDYRALKERDQVLGRGVFVAEGAKVLELWASAGRYPFRSVFLGENRIDAVRGALARLPDHVPVYVAPAAVMDRVAGFPVHRGCLAAGARGAQDPLGTVLPGLGVPVTVMVGLALSNHDNVGALYRNARALGASMVVLDQASADPLYRKAIRVSMGHVLTMPSAARAGAMETLAALRAAGFVCWAATPRRDARDLGELLRERATVIPERLAIVVGSEGEGLDESALAAAEVAIRIPMSSGVDSLNVATAAAIIGFAVQALRAG